MSEYEFNDKENKQFTEFSFSLFILSVSLGAVGLIIMVLGFVSHLNITVIITGFAFIAIAVSLFLPVQDFKNIVSTDGSDMNELINGFTVLSRGFTFVLGATIFLQLMILVGYIQNI